MAQVKTQKFPRQFKKRISDNIDWLLMLILFLSLFLHFLLIRYILKNPFLFFRPVAVQKMHEQYAKVVSERGELIMPSPILRQGNIISSLGGGEGSSVGAGEAVEGQEGVGTGSSAGTGRPSGTGGRQAGTGVSGEEGLAGMEAAVGNVGLLGVLSSGSGYVQDGYIASISNYGDAENERLGRVLAGLNGTQVARGSGGNGRGGAGGGNGRPVGGRSLRGDLGIGRGGLGPDELIGSLAGSDQLGFGGTGYNEEYGQLASGLGGGTLPANRGVLRDQSKRRDPEEVQAIINKHRLAITDCYKIRLRENPGLRGRVEVRIAIDEQGKVSWAEIISSTMDDEELHSCIISRIRRWNDFGPGDPTAQDEVYRQTYTFGY